MDINWKVLATPLEQTEHARKVCGDHMKMLDGDDDAVPPKKQKLSNNDNEGGSVSQNKLRTLKHNRKCYRIC